MLATLIAVLLRGFVPAGWMPDNDNGFMRISICSGMGTYEAWVDRDGNLIDQEPAHSENIGCDYAVLASLFLPSQGTADPTASATWVIQQVIFGNNRDNVWQGLAAPPPPKTGPPVIL